MTTSPPASLEEARDAEASYIAERRRLLDPRAKPDHEQVRRSLVGLALSGGGIRSATTNLGLLQALARMRILPHVDYLCTVSGGGYIGGCLSALLSLNRTAAGAGGPWRPAQHEMAGPGDAAFTTVKDRFPFRDVLGGWPASGRPEIKQLRTHGNFLVTRKGFFTTETLRSIGGLITGVIYHWVLFTLALAMIASFGLWLTLGILVPDGVTRFKASMNAATPTPTSSGSDSTSSAAPAPGLRQQMAATLAGANATVAPAAAAGWRDPTSPFRTAAVAGAAVALGVFAFVWMAIPAYRRWGRPKEGESREDAFHRRLMKWIRRLGLLSLGCAALWLRLGYAPFGAGAIADPSAWLWLPLTLGLGFWVAALALYMLLPWGEIVAWRGGDALRQLWTRQFRSAWGSVVALALYWVVGAIALGVFPFAALAVQAVSVQALIGAVVSALASRGLATRLGGIPGVRPRLSPGVKKALLGVLVGIFILIMVVLLGGLLMSSLPTADVALAPTWTGPDSVVSPRVARAVASSAPYALLTGGAFIALCVLGVAANANKIGLHYFYRDRLIETFLRAEVANRALTLDLVHDAMDMRLKELHGVPPGATTAADYRRCVSTSPLLLVSCAINLAERRDLTRKDRKSGYFTFSKLHCGSYHTGYRATTDYQAGEVKLARAMTISGAAVGSGMGHQTFFAQAFATTLFNLRLGYWMENPGKPPRMLRSRSERPIFSPWYLLREMVSWTHARGRLVNLSDGGHTGDNVGIYPLLQRRCQVIVACDAEADPHLAFGSFTEALRHAYIDMNIDVDIDLSMIRPDPATGRSRSHCAIGRIKYPRPEPDEPPPPAEAWLIYLKNSLTGDEPEPMKNYKVAHAAFPHETTADQFFDDAQFESYRALGDHMAEHTFQPALGAGAPFTDRWLRTLLRSHSTFKAVEDPDYWRAAATLASIEDKLAADPQLRWYHDECYRPPSSRQPTAAPLTLPLLTSIFLEQARLMEQVYLALELRRYANAPDNRGWMNVFRSWSRSPTFQIEFAAARDFFVAEFVEFYQAYIQGRRPIDDDPIPHPWDSAFPKGAPPVYLDPGRREAEA